MLKKLRLKFVCITMAMVLVMLCVIFGMMYFFTARTLEADTFQMLRSAVDAPFQNGYPGMPNEELRLPYFTVEISPWGALIENGSEYYDLSQEEILEIVQAAVNTGLDAGHLEDYGLRFCRGNDMMAVRYVFADTSSERAILGNMVKICAVVGVVAFGVFLLLSMTLARWAVKPVEKAWTQQRQFVADASHELKTPLTVIMTNAELLSDPECEPQQLGQSAQNILTMSRQMRQLVEGLLELARVDNGAVQTAFEKVELSALVEEALLPFEPVYFERGLALEARIQGEVAVSGSVSHLKQVVEILLDNAMKYSQPEGTIWVTLEGQGNLATLKVANPGMELDEQEREKIFERFYRADTARSRDGSYGLGLSIAKSVVEDHRGKIWADSKNGWNIFTVQLPLHHEK